MVMPSKIIALSPPRLYVSIALISTLAASIASFTLVMLGWATVSLLSFGIVSTTLFSFLLTLNFSWKNGESKDDFLKRGPLRTAIATSFTVAYLLLLALSTNAQLSVSLNNGWLSNFHLVYLFVIGFYFVTASVERVVDIVKGKSSLFGS